MDAIILCGGQGSRIRHLLPEGTPKAMADINGTPFVDILRNHLRFHGFQRFVLCIGMGYRQIMAPFGILDYIDPDGTGEITNWSVTIDRQIGEEIWFSYERELLGTGGALKNAKPCICSDPFLVVNGDTLCDVDYEAMLAYHKATNSTITVACDSYFRHVGTFVASRRLIELIPSGVKVDMAEIFTLLGQRHEPVGWFMTDAPFYDIGDEAGLMTFRNYWARLPKGGEGRVVDTFEDPR